MTTYENIGRLLKAARERCGLSQEQAAKYLGIVREALSYYENGRREIDLVSLKKLADLYGYSIEHFLSEAAVTETMDLAFRADELNEQDLEVVAWARRVVRNIQELDNLLGKEKH
jgi:transcriptional regulator with XRE-family HTH domain